MKVKDILEIYQKEKGWSDSVAIEIFLDFLDLREEEEEFLDFLEGYLI